MKHTYKGPERRIARSNVKRYAEQTRVVYWCGIGIAAMLLWIVL